MKKLYIALLFIIVLTAGMLLMNCVPSNGRQTQSANQITEEWTKDILDQMFPDSKYKIENGKILFSSQIPSHYETLYIEQLRFGQFIDNEQEFFVVLRAPEEVTVHAGGFYYAIGAVFDAKTNLIKSPLVDFAADEGEISILPGSGKDLILFLGSSTFQGYTMATGGIYVAPESSWKRIWPEENNFWDNRYAIFGNNRLMLYKKVIEQVNYETTVPPYHFEPDQELIWNSMTESFEAPLYN